MALKYYHIVNNHIYRDHNDTQIRYEWKIGSMVSIFSRSVNSWFNGQIDDIYIDSITNKEWFIVKYGKNKKKSIQRLCEDIKPIDDNSVDQEEFANFVNNIYKHHVLIQDFLSCNEES